MSKPMGIPEDLVSFLQGTGGHSLIVKGPAGTGKTTFALQLVEEMGDIGGSYYMSIRVSDESLYRQFPWLREKIKKHDLVRAGRGFLRSVHPGEVPKEEAQEGETVRGARALIREVSDEEVRVTRVDRTELNKLEGRVEMGQEGDEVYDKLGEGQVVEDSIVFDLGSDLPEIDMAYEAVESNLPKKSLVIIDSIDALSERYGIHASKLINTLQKDLVENSNTNVLYVLESSGETRLDYLGDGVVQLRSQELAGRRVRLMTIEKLRGTEIKQHKYVFTLKDGRVRAFSTKDVEAPAKVKRWEAVPDISKDTVSTGNEELDSLIKGLQRGRIVAIEAGTNVSSKYMDPLLLGLVANSAVLGRGVAYMPARKSTSELVKEAMGPYVGDEIFDNYTRVFEWSPMGSLEGSTHAIQLEGSSVETDLKWSTVEYNLPKAKHPFLSLMAFDTLESVYGEKVLEEMTGHLSSIRKNRDIFVGITTPATKCSESLANLASVHIKIENLDGCILLYGEKLYTGLYNLSYQYSRGYPKAILTPIV